MRTKVSISLAGLCAVSFFAGLVAAADPRLDQADDNVIKAIALVEASEAGTQPDDPKFEKHRVQALKRLCGAREVLAKMRALPFAPGEGDPCFEFTLQ
jgi:hypothetical protein